MDVRALMTGPVRTLITGDTLSSAAKLMRDEAIGCVLIVDRQGALAGILTDRDIALTAYELAEALWRIPVERAMHSPVYSCRAGDDLASAARTMRAHRVRRLPVVDEARSPLGMISLDDLAHASCARDAAPGLAYDELGALLDAVSGRSRHARAARPR